MRNLWQDLENLKGDTCNPVDLVKEQSDFLQEGTNNLFYIDIDTFGRVSNASAKMLEEAEIERDFLYKMALCSEELPDYSFNILCLYYGISFYPLLVSTPREIGLEIIESGVTPNLENSGNARIYFKINSEDDFEQVLGMILNSEKVRTILRNMKSIIGNVDEEE